MRREGKRSRLKSIAILGLILVVAVVSMCFLGARETVGAADAGRYKYYTHIVVGQGDSLWDIAGEYMTKEYDGRKAYIAELRSINRLDSDTIYAGQMIIVPYYDDECK